MKLITRTDYMPQLIDLLGTPDIKVITGMRRSGKSELMKSTMEYVGKHDRKANIIYVDFYDLQYDSLKDYKSLYAYVENLYNPKKNNYLFIDEAQLCKKFELAINSFHNSKKYDIYITGSNGKLLSSDLATLFTGRFIEVHVFPFSFKEYCQYFGGDDKNRLFDRYVLQGGMAGSYVYGQERNRKAYIEDVYRTIVTKDILKRNQLPDAVLMEHLTEYLMDNVGNLTSVNKISDTLTSNKVATNHTTVGRYIQHLCMAYMFYRVRRYDIKGKRYLDTADKFYLNDLGMRYVKLGNKNLDYGRLYENLVAVELLRRGYEIYVGKLYQKEIDFVAKRGSETIYIQVSDNIADKNTFQREWEPLTKIKDNYPKMILARTRHEEYQVDGIIVRDLVEWMGVNA